VNKCGKMQKTQSLQTLNEAYRALKDGMVKQNDQLRQNVQQLTQRVEDLKREVDKLKEKKNTI